MKTTPQEWARGMEGKPVKVRNIEEFVTLCMKRERYEQQGATWQEWLELSREFEKINKLANADACRGIAMRIKYPKGG